MEELNESFVDAAASVYRAVKQMRPLHSSKFSPKKFSIAQIETLIFLIQLRRMAPSQNMQAFRAAPREDIVRRIKEIRLAAPRSFRGLVKMLEGSKALREALELKRVPSYSTLHKAEHRLRCDFQEELIGFAVHIITQSVPCGLNDRGE